MSRCRSSAATLAVIGCMALPLTASGQEICPDGDLIPADISGFSQLALVPVGEGDFGGGLDLFFCPTTRCFYALGSGEIQTNVGFQFGRDAHGAMVMQSCDVPNSPRPFTAVLFESDPETLPEGMENPAPNSDNCIREMERHKDDDGEPGGSSDACLVMDGNIPTLLIRKNGGAPMIAIDAPVDPGAPNECDGIKIPRVEIDSDFGRVLVDVTLPTRPDCTVSLAQSGEEVIVLGPAGLPQPAPGDINGDGSVDIDDVLAVLRLRNELANPPGDRTDLNGDGLISGLDARIVVTMCDLPRCARQP